MRLRSSARTTLTKTKTTTTAQHAVETNNDNVGYTQNKKVNNNELLNIGPLVEGKLIQRPAKPTTSSPYIAEVQLKSTGESVLAWAPSLDVGGLCVAGSTVWLSETSKKTNPDGSLKKKQTMSTHAIELVQMDEPGSPSVLIGANPNLGEKLAYEVLLRGLLEDEIGFGPALDEKSLTLLLDKKKGGNARTKKSNMGRTVKKQKLANDETYGGASSTTESSDGNAPMSLSSSPVDDANYGPPDQQVQVQVLLKRQQTHNDSRIDVELQKNGKRCLIEIKNAVCADYCKDTAPIKKGKNHCVVTSELATDEYQRSGLFPWGRKTQQFEEQKVVSARAIKHVRNLVELLNKEESAPDDGASSSNDDCIETSCMVLFVLNRADCRSMRACHEGCSVFATELKKAAEAGVLVRSFRVKWTSDGLAYFDGFVPVDFSKTPV